MPTQPKPRKHPARQGVYAEAVRPETTADAYRWRCDQCDCQTNLRGLLRSQCAHCHHIHPQPPPKEAA